MYVYIKNDKVFATSDVELSIIPNRCDVIETDLDGHVVYESGKLVKYEDSQERKHKEDKIKEQQEKQREEENKKDLEDKVDDLVKRVEKLEKSKTPDKEPKDK